MGIGSLPACSRLSRQKQPLSRKSSREKAIKQPINSLMDETTKKETRKINQNPPLQLTITSKNKNLWSIGQKSQEHTLALDPTSGISDTSKLSSLHHKEKPTL
jgi:hypothetical protein